jgi:hypothetical protein
MKATRTRLVGVAAALSAIALAAPVSTAGAARAAPAVVRPADTGPKFITSAPATFINTNNQVSPGGNSSGNQVAA